MVTGVVFGVLFCLFLLFLVGQVFWVPLKILLRLGYRVFLGGFLLFLLNLVTAYWNWGIGINFWSALTVGLLGFPGILLLAAFKYFFLD
ncbi:MAG: Pro-sigmaK processing inhibitor [Thermoanaerobacterales bacterium 50_218]|nr:MAG: Pro-sigmaK processing inhibitor [Thermoanaerobacterales bacterium 50_218]HAA89731.1 hypothetical protein [Peptococcaceae bacterium]